MSKMIPSCKLLSSGVAKRDAFPSLTNGVFAHTFIIFMTVQHYCSIKQQACPIIRNVDYLMLNLT